MSKGSKPLIKKPPSRYKPTGGVSYQGASTNYLFSTYT